MNEEFYFSSQEDKERCISCWEQEIELTIDDLGRVYTEAGTYIADIIKKSEEI